MRSSAAVAIVLSISAATALVVSGPAAPAVRNAAPPPVRRVAPPLPLHPFSRRAIVLGAPLAALACAPALPAQAAGVPSQEELSRLATGYGQLLYLLENWEAETTVCIKGCVGKSENCGCVRNPIIVQEYMGYKDMRDPLFKADQLMIRAEPLVSEQAKLEKYSAAIDRWVEKADEGNVMAYVSSWGEANPGGGQDNIAAYLEKSRKEVVESAEILKTICQLLELPLPGPINPKAGKGGSKSNAVAPR